MSKLKLELQRLKEIGGTESLASEMEAFIETLESQNSIPVSRKLLAEAAKAIQNNALDVAHDFIGSAIEAYTGNVQIPDEVMSQFSAAAAPEGALDWVPLPELAENALPFEQATEEVVSGFANILVTAGYVDEAGKYLSGYNTLMATGQGEQGMKDLDTLKKMREKFKAEANLGMVRTLDQVIAGMEDEENVTETLEEPVTVEEPKAEDKPAEEPAIPTEEPAPAPEGETKPVLEVEPEGEEEKKEKEAAEAAVLKGDIKAAKNHIRKVRSMERARIIAALVKAGDFDLASEGLAEAEAEEIPADDVKPEEKNAGMAPDALPPEVKDEEATSEEKLPEEVEQKTDADAPAPAPVEEEKDEMEEAKEIAAAAKRFARTKRMEKATAALAKLDKLEKDIMEGVRVAEQEIKNPALAQEGYAVWKSVRKSHLSAQAVVAAAEGDEEAKQEAMEAMEALESEEEVKDSLDSAPAEGKEITEAPVMPAGGKPEVAPAAPAPVAPVCEDGDQECEEGEEKEGEVKEDETAEAMKYEVLQAVDTLKNMKVTSDDLAFTLWTSEKDPYWTVQACGKPVAEVHLADQTDSSAIADFFTDEQKWPMVVAQTTSKVGLYEMLKGVNARFYANAVQNSKLAKSMKAEAVAEVKKATAEKVAVVRSNLTEAVMVAADSLNKGLIPGKQNALKRAFADRLMSLGIHNPGLIVEDCFAEGFNGFMQQVMADANELLEMPKEAFAHTKKMVSASTNVAQQLVNNLAQETMSQRLARTSMPLAPMAPMVEAPAVQEAIAEATKVSSKEQRQALRKRLNLSAKF